MSPRAEAHLASLQARCDEAIARRSAAQQRTLREVDIRDELCAVMRRIADVYTDAKHPTSLAAFEAINADLWAGIALVDELDELHAQAIFVREVA